MAETIVELEGVVKRFGETVAVDGISLSIEEQDFVTIIGPSGCGKTTTLRLIAGLEEPTDGTVYFRGKPMNDVKPWQRDMPLVWQNFALFPFLTVAQNVEFGLQMKRIDKATRREKVRQWLGRVGIAELANRRIAQLSSGQKQRVALARSLVIDPEILLLDEPLGSLDAHLRVRMQSELAGLQKELGITFIYVTHNQSEALAMAKRIVIMDAGKIHQIGSPREVYRAPANRFVAEFVGTNNIFTGQVAGVENGRARIATKLGEFEAPVANLDGLGAGDEITFVISADRIITSAEGEPKENRVQGRITGEEFFGSTVTLYLELEDGAELRVQKQQHQIEQLQVQLGDRLWISWATEHAYILPS